MSDEGQEGNQEPVWTAEDTARRAAQVFTPGELERTEDDRTVRRLLNEPLVESGESPNRTTPADYAKIDAHTAGPRSGEDSALVYDYIIPDGMNHQLAAQVITEARREAAGLPLDEQTAKINSMLAAAQQKATQPKYQTGNPQSAVDKPKGPFLPPKRS